MSDFFYKISLSEIDYKDVTLIKLNPGEKVRTTKIITSKLKKNIKNVSKHQNIESVF